MNIIYNYDNYVEYEVDGEVWGYVCDNIDVFPADEQPMPVFLLQDKIAYPYAYWAWAN